MDKSQPEADLNFANAIIDPFTRGVSIYLADKQPGRITVVDHLVMSVFPPEGTAQPSCPIKLTNAAAGRLMDALWQAGIRPSDQLDSVGHLGALKAHLEDMRQLTFKTLSMEKP